MALQKEYAIFEEFVRNKGLKHSEQRKDILKTFLKTERHMTVEELHRIVKKENPSIGAATVYRTLKLFIESGLCRELKLDDGVSRYEHLYGHEHHDHIVCKKCGKFVEVMDPEIEKLQERLAKKEGFVLKGHKLLMYGICRECNK